MLIRLLLFLSIAYLVFKFILSVRKLWSAAPKEALGNDNHKQHQEVSDLVKDPVCGVYLAVSDSVSIMNRGERVFFCSENCRKRFIENRE